MKKRKSKLGYPTDAILSLAIAFAEKIEHLSTDERAELLRMMKLMNIQLINSINGQHGRDTPLSLREAVHLRQEAERDERRMHALRTKRSGK